jgi:hypothetical protein
MNDNFNYDHEQEKSLHPENFEPAIDERGDDSGKGEAVLDDDLPDIDSNDDNEDFCEKIREQGSRWGEAQRKH